MPKNIFIFTVRYINNILPTQSNLSKWGISSSSDCSFCLSPETLLHIVAGGRSHLDQGCFTWRHVTVLKFIAKSLTAVIFPQLVVADHSGFYRHLHYLWPFAVTPLYINSVNSFNVQVNISFKLFSNCLFHFTLFPQELYISPTSSGFPSITKL